MILRQLRLKRQREIMPGHPKLPDTYSQINDFMEDLKKGADFNTRLLLMQQSLEAEYLKKEKIDEKIWEAITKHQKNIDKIQISGEKNRINWTAIVQALIIAVLTAAVTAFLIKRV